MFYLTLETSKRSCFIFNVKSCTIALNYFRLKTFITFEVILNNLFRIHLYNKKILFWVQIYFFLFSEFVKQILLHAICLSPFLEIPYVSRTPKKLYNFFLSSLTVKSKMEQIFIFISNYYSIV